MTPIDDKTTPSVQVQVVPPASPESKLRFDTTTGLTAVKIVATITWKAWRMGWGHERRAEAMEDINRGHGKDPSVTFHARVGRNKAHRCN